jgi:hypothetical protein
VQNCQSIDAGNCYKIRGEFVTRTIAGETIIVPIRTQVADMDSIYNLNAVAMKIWSLLDGQTSVTQIAQSVCAEFDVTEAQAQQDTLEFIASLEQAGIAVPA